MDEVGLKDAITAVKGTIGRNIEDLISATDIFPCPGTRF
jgi:hypothetical protein